MPSQFIYHDPPIASLLIISTYFYFLNLFGWAFEWLLPAGLLGQILIGIIWGSPLSEWLHVEWQETFVVVGYVGLLLVVFEGEGGSGVDGVAMSRVLTMYPLHVERQAELRRRYLR